MYTLRGYLWEEATARSATFSASEIALLCCKDTASSLSNEHVRD